MRISDWSSDVCSADLWASVGIHPHDADHHPDVETAKLVERAAHSRVIGIGETGLDYYYDKSDRARQQDSFRRHIHASQRTGLPIKIGRASCRERVCQYV